MDVGTLFQQLREFCGGLSTVTGRRTAGGADTGAARIRWPRRAPLTQAEHGCGRLSPPCQLQPGLPVVIGETGRIQPPAAVRQQSEKTHGRLQLMPFVAGPAGGVAMMTAVALMCGR